MGPRGLQELSWEFGPLCGGPLWAHLGPILGYLGPRWPFWGGPGGLLEAYAGLGRLDLGVQGGQKLNVKEIKVAGRFRKAKELSESLRGLVVGLKL